MLSYWKEIRLLAILTGITLEVVLRVLLTGGAGYIGTHILLKMLHRELDVLVLDTFVIVQKPV